MLGYVAFVEHRRMSSIGFQKPGILDLVLAVAVGILMVGGIVVIYFVIFPALHLKMNATVMGSLMATPFWYRLLLVTRAAVAEEILFRGYPIERLLELTGSRTAAAVLSWAAFTYAHLAGWGWAQLIVAGYGGVLLRSSTCGGFCFRCFSVTSTPTTPWFKTTTDSGHEISVFSITRKDDPKYWSEGIVLTIGLPRWPETG